MVNMGMWIIDLIRRFLLEIGTLQAKGKNDDRCYSMPRFGKTFLSEVKFRRGWVI